TGVEDRDVECYQQPNTASYTIETIRIDTGEVIFSRDMDPMERNQAMQGELPFNNPSVRRAVRAARAKDDAVYPLRPVTDLDDDEIEAGAAGHDDEVGGDDEGGDPVDFKPLPEKRFDPSDDDDLPIMTEEGEPE
ncbi:MAG: hypothetical protein MJA83_14985, partial [Gammaproteobacteria bacterium]|nr:hypothetical protein [Gammaproteobacteria bacterium]